MLHGVPGTTGFGIGDVEHDERLEIGAGARLLEHIAAAGAVADRQLLGGVDQAELVRLGRKRIIGGSAASDGKGTILVHG